MSCILQRSHSLILNSRFFIWFLKLSWSLFVFSHYVASYLSLLLFYLFYDTTNSWHECSEFDSRTSAVTLQHHMSITSWNCRSKDLTHTDFQLIARKHDFYSNCKVWKAFWLTHVQRQSKKATLICHKTTFQASRKHWLILYRIK